MELKNILDQFQQEANPARRKVLMKQGAQETAIGVPLGFIRKLAKTLGTNHELAEALWATEIVDAQLLSVMLMDGSQLSTDVALGLIDQAETDPLLDDLVFRCLVNMKASESLLKILQNSNSDTYQKVYWAFKVNQLKQKPVDPKLAQLILTSCEMQLVNAPEKTQWMLNRCLAELGFRHPEYTEQCLEMGQRLGVYSDMKVAKGCTSAYVPEWINAVIK